LFFGWPGAVFAANDTNPYTGDPKAIAEGHDLFLSNGCYSCHGHKAEGAVGPDLTDDVWVFKPTDRTLFKTIAKGRKGTVMVAWGKQISHDQIWKIIVWIRSIYRGDPKKIVW